MKIKEAKLILCPMCSERLYVALKDKKRKRYPGGAHVCPRVELKGNEELKQCFLALRKAGLPLIDSYSLWREDPIGLVKMAVELR